MHLVHESSDERVLRFLLQFEALMSGSVILTCTVCFMVGFFLFGCDSLVTGPVIQDIAERYASLFLRVECVTHIS